MSFEDKMQAAQTRLDAARRQAEDARKASAEAEALREMELEAEALEQETAAQKSLPGRHRVVRTDGGCVVLKAPHPALMNRFRDEAKFDTESLGKLVRGSLVYPSVSQLEGILAEYPFALDKMADAVVEMAQGRDLAVSKK